MSKRIYVAGHNGMVGSAIVRQLEANAKHTIITRSRKELDLLDQASVSGFFKAEAIDQVYLAAARVGGIHANNTYPANFIYENLTIQNNIIHAAHMADVDELLFLGSSCIYPKLCPQPMQESYLLTGALEPTNEPYAVAKIAGIKMCESYNRQYKRHYRSVMPTNLYGPGDNFHPENSHVIPGMINRFYEAVSSKNSEMKIWGSGTPKREFLHVDDMASASVHVMGLSESVYQSVVDAYCSHINVGTGEDCSIAELAQTIAKTTGFAGELVFDKTKPDGTPRKLLDVSRLHDTGWQHRIDLEQGLAETWDWFLSNRTELRAV